MIHTQQTKNQAKYLKKTASDLANPVSLVQIRKLPIIDTVSSCSLEEFPIGHFV